MAPAHPIANATPAVNGQRSLLDALAVFIERAARTPASASDGERYWTSVARGL
jgi:hypothetical protein